MGNDTFFPHSCAEALLQPTVAALVALVFVDDAVSAESAGVDVVLPDAAPEEALTAVAAGGAVVLPRRPVAADRAVLADALGAQAQVIGRAQRARRQPVGRLRCRYRLDRQTVHICCF